MFDNLVLLAFGLTFLAGMATGIGSFLALLLKKTSDRFLSVALGFSAGFMIYISFVEILPDARIKLIDFWGDELGSWVTIAAFFGGIAVMAIIDRLVPEVENPHEARHIEDMNPQSCRRDKLMRLGFMSAVAIAVHNFPEGIATFASTLQEPTFGIAIAIAIAIHNIPEGIAVAVPIYCATLSRRKAFRWSLLSGLSEPLGGLIAYLILAPFLNELTMGIILASVAGVMIYISLDELLPSAREYGAPHHAILGLSGGMLIMAISLQLFL